MKAEKDAEREKKKREEKAKREADKRDFDASLAGKAKKHGNEHGTYIDSCAVYVGACKKATFLPRSMRAEWEKQF